MKNYKNILYLLGKFALSLFIYLIIVTLLAHFNIINYKVVGVLNLIFMILFFAYSGFSIGRVSEKRGYLSGLIIGLINIVLILILALLFRSFPELKTLIYFSILLLSSTLGGMFGINKRKN